MKQLLALSLLLLLAGLHLVEAQNTPQGCKTDSDCGSGAFCKDGLFCMAGSTPSTTTAVDTNESSGNGGGGGSGAAVINCTIQTLNQCGSDWGTRFKQPLILGIVIGGGVFILILIPTIVCCVVKGACCAARKAAKTGAGVVGGVAKGVAAGVSGPGYVQREDRDRRLAPPSLNQINDHRDRNYGGTGGDMYSPSNWNGARNDDKSAAPNLHNSNPRRSDARNYETYDAPARQRSLPRNNAHGPAPLPEGYRRAPQFPLDDDPAVIAARAREERDREYNRERSPRRVRSAERHDANAALQQGPHQPFTRGEFVPQGQHFVPMMQAAPVVMVPQQQPYGYMAAAPQPVYGYTQPQQAFMGQQQPYGYPQQQQPLYPPGSQFQQSYNPYSQPSQNLSPPAPSSLQSNMLRDPTSTSSNPQTFVDRSFEDDSVNYNSLTAATATATQILPRDAPPTYRRTAPRDVKSHPTVDAELNSTSQDTPARHSHSSDHIETPILHFPSHRVNAEDDVISGYMNEDDDVSSRDESLLRHTPGVNSGTVTRSLDPAVVSADASVRRERGNSEAASHSRLQLARHESREVAKRSSAEVRLFAHLSAEEKRLSNGEAAALLNQNWKRRSREVEFPAGSKRNSAALRGIQTGSDGSGSMRAAVLDAAGRGESRERMAESAEPIVPGSYTPRPRTGGADQQQPLLQDPVATVQPHLRAANNPVPESNEDRDRSLAPAGRIHFDSLRNQTVAPMGRLPYATATHVSRDESSDAGGGARL